MRNLSLFAGAAFVCVALFGCKRAGESARNGKLSGANLPKSDTRSDDLLLVQNVLAKLLGLKSQEVRPELTLRQLHVDDLDLVEAVMEIEDTLKIQIPDQVLTSAAEPQSTQAALDQLTVKQLAAIVTANRNSR